MFDDKFVFVILCILIVNFFILSSLSTKCAHIGLI